MPTTDDNLNLKDYITSIQAKLAERLPTIQFNIAPETSKVNVFDSLKVKASEIPGYGFSADMDGVHLDPIHLQVAFKTAIDAVMDSPVSVVRPIDSGVWIANTALEDLMHDRDTPEASADAFVDALANALISERTQAIAVQRQVASQMSAQSNQVKQAAVSLLRVLDDRSVRSALPHDNASSAQDADAVLRALIDFRDGKCTQGNPSLVKPLAALKEKILALPPIVESEIEKQIVTRAFQGVLDSGITTAGADWAAARGLS